MTEVLIEHRYINSGTNNYKIYPGMENDTTSQVFDPVNDQCRVGAMIDRPKCWTHSHDVALKFWNPIPERRIECSVDMPGMDPCTTERCITSASYLCRHCTMVIRRNAWLLAGETEYRTVANGVCYVSERGKCVERTVDFDVPPPPSRRLQMTMEDRREVAG